jgi:hypothetical protein
MVGATRLGHHADVIRHSIHPKNLELPPPPSPHLGAWSAISPSNWSGQSTNSLSNCSAVTGICTPSLSDLTELKRSLVSEVQERGKGKGEGGGADKCRSNLEKIIVEMAGN